VLLLQLVVHGALGGQQLRLQLRGLQLGGQPVAARLQRGAGGLGVLLALGLWGGAASSG
jgi:hypothetical protein